MIPEFPTFKHIDLSDASEVRAITSRFKPYSDFNFISMWSWNLVDEIAFSKLNGNLVVKFTDYVTSEPFFSFIGDNQANETCEALIDFSIKNGLSPVLKLIPEVSAKAIDPNKFKVTESRDHFDYIYSLDELKDYPGRKFAKKRNHVSGFMKKFPHAVSRAISLKDLKNISDVLELSHRWHIAKAQNESDPRLHDLAALKRLLLGVEVFNLVNVGVFIDDRLVAFFVNEIIDSEYALAHMMKADASIDDGLHAFLMKKNAEALSSFNCKFFNYEQDLGLENLRIAKSRFFPVDFLKKYEVDYLHRH